jgi:hypothetical protein
MGHCLTKMPTAKMPSISVKIRSPCKCTSKKIILTIREDDAPLEEKIKKVYDDYCKSKRDLQINEVERVKAERDEIII